MAITFGDAGAPSNISVYLDSLFSQTLSNYNRTIVDNIGKTNGLFKKLMASPIYESESGGTDIRIPLMYGINSIDSYAGYDELSTAPNDDVTSAVYEWRQLATQIVYNMTEVRKNSGQAQLVNMVKTKIKQAEMGIQEGFITHFLQGSGDGALATPRVSTVNGSYSIDPLPKLIEYSTTAQIVGNVDASTNTWWRNQTKTSSATTYEGLLKEMVNMYNNCGKGTGGAPDIILADQTTYELLQFAFYQKYRQVNTDPSFDFDNMKFMKSLVIWDEKVPNVSAGTTDTTTASGGSLYFINTKFFHVKYMSGMDFAMLKDDNGKSFAKPINGDSRVGHMAWMGNFCVSNRRKHGVIGNIARTLT